MVEHSSGMFEVLGSGLGIATKKKLHFPNF